MRVRRIQPRGTAASRRRIPGHPVPWIISITLLAGVIGSGCDPENDPLLGSAGGGGGDGARDSLVAVFDILSGNLQTGSTLGTFVHPLRVRALDARGFGIPGVDVRWELTRGVATLSASGGLTDSLGIAEVLVTAGSVLGPIEARASVGGSTLHVAEFDLLVTAIQIQILADRFVGPLGGDTVDVVAGDTVEWLNRDVQGHLLRSIQEPEGGVVIRSDTLRNSDRYRFVPNTPGTWVYEDQISPTVTAPRGVIRAAGRQDAGGLRVALDQAAGDPPPRPVLVTIDGGVFASSIFPGDTVLFPALTAIPHVVRLRDVPLNCVVAGENPRTVDVIASDTVQTRFEIGCSG